MIEFHRKLADSRAAPLVPYVGLGIYVASSVLYLFPSGTPQPADYVLFATMATSLLLIWPRLPSEPLLHMALALFVGWIVVVNACWFLLTGDFDFLQKSSFYIYNAVVLVFVVMAGSRNWNRLKRAVWLALLISLMLELVHLAVVPEADRRALGSFNNPNQLGYWALLLMACLGVCKGHSKLGPWDLLVLGGAFYVVMLSLSKAASIAAMLMLLVILVTRGFRQSTVVLTMSVLVIALSVQLGTGTIGRGLASLDPVAALTQRLASIGQQRDDDLGERGYDRIVENPHLVAFGAGEGAFERFDPKDARELHSTLGNVLMSYGVVGLGLFVVLLVIVFARVPLASILYMGPIMAYNMTHMGLRFSLFWIFLGLVYAQARYGRPDVVQSPNEASEGSTAASPLPSARVMVPETTGRSRYTGQPTVVAPQAGRSAALPPEGLPSARR